MKKMILLAVCLMNTSLFSVGGGEKENHVTPGLLLPFQKEQLALSNYITEIHQYNNEMRHVVNMLVIIYSANLFLKAVEVTSEFAKHYCRYRAKRKRLEKLKLKKELDAKRSSEQCGDSPSGVLPSSDTGNIEQATV